MIGMRLQEAKANFFDLKKITDPAERATAQALSRFGAFVRTRARSSIRKRKLPSKPGSPPSSHAGWLRGGDGKPGILFAYERARQGVVIGPVLLNMLAFGGDGRPVSGTVPKVLEEGGQIGILEVFKFGRWQRANLARKRRLDGLQTRLRKVAIQARPYMLPAFNEEVKKAPGLWAGQIK